MAPSSAHLEDGSPARRREAAGLCAVLGLPASRRRVKVADRVIHPAQRVVYAHDPLRQANA